MSDFTIIRRPKISGHFEVFVPPGKDVIVPYWLSGVHAGNEAWAQSSGPCTLHFTMEHAEVWNKVMGVQTDLSASTNNPIHGEPRVPQAPDTFGALFNADQGMMWSEPQTMIAGRIISVPLTATGVRIVTTSAGVRVIVAGSN